MKCQRSHHDYLELEFQSLLWKPPHVCTPVCKLLMVIEEKSLKTPGCVLSVLHSNKHVKSSKTFCFSAWLSLQSFLWYVFLDRAVNYHPPLCTALTVGRNHKEQLNTSSLGRLLLSRGQSTGTVTRPIKCAHTTWECAGWHSHLVTGKIHQTSFSIFSACDSTYLLLAEITQHLPEEVE